MTVPILTFLDSFEAARPWLRDLGFQDPPAAHRNFVAIALRGVPLDLLDEFRTELARFLPHLPDPDRALNNFERLLGKVRSPLSMMTFLFRKRNSLAVLMQLFGASQYFSELLIQTPEYFDYLWEAGPEPVEPASFLAELEAEFAAVNHDEDRIMSLIRIRRQREILRIGYRDIILGEPLDRITRSIADLADSLTEAALRASWRKRSEKHGVPRTSTGELARGVVLGLGKLGGRELNYSSDIDLIVIYDEDGFTDGRKSIDNASFFAGVVQDIVRFLSHPTGRGVAYRVDLRLRPHGSHAPLALSLERTVAYYDRSGRTWERQALIKARPIAGAIELGAEFLAAMTPFIYRRFLSHNEINEIKAIKRRIEVRTREAGADTLDLKTGQGGIRDTEFTVQFLQLLHGHRVPELREPNTLTALRRLARLKIVNNEEYAAMETAYRFLRKAEHRLQFMFDLQTHRIPDDPGELDRFAARLGYSRHEEIPPGDRFLDDLRQISGRNRATLDRLLHGLFPDDTTTGDEPESDLILDPEPEPARIESLLRRYGFQDPAESFRLLQSMAQEDIPFLSSVRCRHFLASIAPALLRALADTPDPDRTLVALAKVSESIGAKGVLWESCQVNPPLLKLCVDLCSRSALLVDILVQNPGMIDELLDSLVMDRPPAGDDLRDDLEGLIRNADEIDPILHSFKSRRLLDIGVHDVLGRAPLRQVFRWLSELADAILHVVCEHHFRRLCADHGPPTLEGTDGRFSRYALIGLGKLGGLESAYSSDLDLVFLYEGEGTTRADLRHRKGSITVQEFYVELVQRLNRTVGRLGPSGKLYAIDFRLRPTGKSGSLVVNLGRFREYYAGGQAQLWERQALTRARVVTGENLFAREVRDAIDAVLDDTVIGPAEIDQVAEMRRRLADSRNTRDFKRGVGGIVDVEFALQLIQLRHGSRWRGIRQPNVWDSLAGVREARLWPPDRLHDFEEGYTFLRTIECRIGILYGAGRSEIPTDAGELRQLALRLGYRGNDAVERFEADLETRLGAIRQAFDAVLDEERTRP
jgi:glutamate-ammonia-ligase adenylyltransferase